MAQKSLGRLTLLEDEYDIILSNGESLKKLANAQQCVVAWTIGDVVAVTVDIDPKKYHKFFKAYLSMSKGLPIVNGIINSYRGEKKNPIPGVAVVFNNNVPVAEKSKGFYSSWVPFAGKEQFEECVNMIDTNGNLMFNGNYLEIPFHTLIRNDQFIVQRASDYLYNIYELGKGEMLDESYEYIEIISDPVIENGKRENKSFYLLKKNLNPAAKYHYDKDIVKNIMDDEYHIIFKDWYNKIDRIEQTVTDPFYAHLPKEWGIDNDNMKQILRYDFSEGFHDVGMIVYECDLKGNIKLFDINFNEIKFPGHSIYEVRHIQIGGKTRIGICDHTATLNFIDSNYKPVFDENHWLTPNQYTTNQNKKYPFPIVANLQSNILNVDTMTLAFEEWGEQIIEYGCPYRWFEYPRMKWTEPSNSYSVACMKKKKGKIDIATLKNDKLFAVFYDFDDVLEDDNGYFFAVKNDKMYLISYLGNFPEADRVIKCDNLNNGFIYKNNKWYPFYNKGLNVSFGSLLAILEVDKFGYDEIYDTDSYFPIVQVDEKYNYYNVQKRNVEFGSTDDISEWFDDVEPVEYDHDINSVVRYNELVSLGNVVFRVKKLGQDWKDIKLKNN